MRLTNRQSTIIELMAKDFNQKNIAVYLKTSLRTIEKEIVFIKQLYKVETTTAIVFNYHFKRKRYDKTRNTKPF